ncbi:MAG TPA: MBL fold metallo-hydrolase, partial [Chryseosolibacter sp.]|nr:MBL fold metallo-hydrolase [Chryseosolibacter sp.]
VILGVSISAPTYQGPVSDYFNGKEFANPGPVKLHGATQALKWMLNRKRTPWKENRDASPGPRPLTHVSEGIRVTFVNHSTFLIQVASLNILTDPIWSRRASPFSWVGPKRMRPPGIRLEDLPRIHLVLLSHNHYDHLDIGTMRTIFAGHHPKIVTPLGVKQFLDRESITGSTDLDWWQEIVINEKVKVQSVPAQHFSGRGMLDRNKTLWCGYIISTPAGNIYFAGDTGYDPAIFTDIGSRCQPIKVSLIPIGAYEPRWFMAPVHISPDEAVKVHQQVGSQKSIASHFGTFPMADEGAEDPVRDLTTALAESDIHAEAFIALKEGDHLIIE